MSSTNSILTILFSIMLAALVTGLSQRFVKPDVRRRHHDVGSVVFLQLGVIFAVLLAFVFSEAWTEYDETERSINLEVSAMHGLAMIAVTLTPSQSKPILTAEKAYIASVIDSEWPVLANTRKEDRKTDRLLMNLVRSVVNVRVSDPDERDKKNALISLLSEAHKQREIRIYQAQNGIPIPLWCLLIGYTIVLALFVSLSSIESVVTAVAIATCFTAGVTSILIMARLLDYPFEGGLGLPSTDFAEVLEKLSAIIESLG